ncbi:unnamed protein product [Lactuca saligna]|uniref:Uncharacterized protein n=1 Tax=Lactuca saligna TaxID=75948 RepID=A0AA36EL80_LACSI|nr:unnamed protein product [Lactuca saligna]
MEEFQQGVLYYQALVENGLIEGEPGMVQGADPGLGLEEYVETDYEYERSDEEMEEIGDIRGVSSEPHSSEMIQDHPIAPEDSTNRMRSLEEEVATLETKIIYALYG